MCTSQVQLTFFNGSTCSQADIWGGNCTISIEGPRAHVAIDSCILQSDSGRGLVCSNQAVCELSRSSIVDCAATGFYLGDWGSRARISGCNIVRNGFGSRRLCSSGDEDEAGNVLGRIATHTRMFERVLPNPRQDFEAVPPGHSGKINKMTICSFIIMARISRSFLSWQDL